MCSLRGLMGGLPSLLGRLGGYSSSSCQVTTNHCVNSAQVRLMRRSAGHREERIVCNEDGSIIMAWHPETKVPYKFTKPVPRNHDLQSTPENTQTSLRLQVQAITDMEELYHHKPRRLQIRDLMRMTWTTKKRWFPRVTHMRRDAATNSPKERPYM